MPANPTPAPKGAIAIALAMLLGLGVVISGGQAKITAKPPGSTTTTVATTTTTSTSTTTGVTTTTAPGATTTTGASTTTTTVPGADPFTQRFGAPGASWNRKVSEFGPATGYLASLKDRFWLYAGYPRPPGSFNVAFKDYSVPIHDLRTAESTNVVRAFQQTEYQNTSSILGQNVTWGAFIPWSSQWKWGTGFDRLMMAVDPTTGEYWGYNGSDLPLGAFGINQCIDRGLPPFIPDGPNAQAGFNENNPNHKCFYGVARNTTTAGTNGDAYTFTDGTTRVERGAGINKFVGITRAIEVDQGVIPHALEFSISSTMFGQPSCSPAKGFSDTRAQGGGCGFYVAPATRVEWAQDPTNRCGNSTENGQINPQTYNSPTVQNRLKTVPEGLRLAINITDPQIEDWLDSRGYTGAKRRTAKIFAVAMRDYGAIVLETGCSGINLETDGILDTRTGGSRDLWAANGITDISGNGNPHGDLLTGLITQANLYVVNPPPG